MHQIAARKTIAILGDRSWLQVAKQEGDKIKKKFICILWKQRIMSAQQCLY